MSFVTKRTTVLFALGGSLLLGMIVAASIGAMPISPLSMLQGDLSAGHQAVLATIRLPRVVLTVLVGAALAVSGAAMQGLFRNPLADPGLIGISSGAALAVAVVIVVAGPASGVFGLYGLSIAAFAGGMITCMVIFRIARISSKAASVAYMLLAGIAINALAGAATGFLTFVSDDQQLRTLTFWTMGSLGQALWPLIAVVASVVIPAVILLICNARQLNIMLLGEQEAQHLGVNSERLKKLIVVCTALSVGAAVAASGIIAFVGLIVPHLIRLAIGPDHRILLPASALAGAVLLLAADTVARTIVAPAEMPVGIVTSLIGGPFFLWFFVRQSNQMETA